MTREPEEREIEALYQRLGKEAEEGGYHLNPDREFTRNLVRGLLVNTSRYGYPSCPCRVASGVREEDLDIVCPCDYRDPDLSEHGACYCALYVDDQMARGEKQPRSIPERRKRRGAASAAPPPAALPTTLPYPVWRCRVCGYLCAREHPPETCPVCKAKKDRFERFL